MKGIHVGVLVCLPFFGLQLCGRDGGVIFSHNHFFLLWLLHLLLFGLLLLLLHFLVLLPLLLVVGEVEATPYFFDVVQLMLV